MDLIIAAVVVCVSDQQCMEYNSVTVSVPATVRPTSSTV